MSGPGFFDLLSAGKRYRAGGPGPKATLMALMERMGDHDGEWTCWPTMAALAFETEQDVRTVRRHIAKFEAAGIIERRARGASGGGRASNLFVLVVEALVAGKADTMSGGETGHPAQANRTPDAEQTGHPTPIAPYMEHPVEVPGTPTARASFDEFYAAFPRHIGKEAARRAWKMAVRRAPAEAIIRGAERYRDDPNRDPEFTCHPATWLNAGRWEDDPLPARTNGRGSVGSRNVAALRSMNTRSLGPPPTAVVPGEPFELRNGDSVTFTTHHTLTDSGATP